MKTNLIFKRQSIIDGVTRTITRIVPIDIPYINSGDGWILSGHADSVEVLDKSMVELFPMEDRSDDVDSKISTYETYVKSNDSTVSTTNEPLKFISDVAGTAKLVRSKGIIKVVYRKGKSTYNQTTPNSICISDLVKNEFFKRCRMWHGETSGIYYFTEKNDYSEYRNWSAFIDEEYRKQQIRALGGH